MANLASPFPFHINLAIDLHEAVVPANKACTLYVGCAS
jgi:hypothetical protein